jgi:hypothetical protein
MNKLWDFFVDTAMSLFLPLVCSYFAFSADLFFNGSCKEGAPLEKAADFLLAPSHYLFMGRSAEKGVDGQWIIGPRFNYQSHFGLKTAGSIVVFVPGFVAGSILKAVAFLDPAVRERFASLQKLSPPSRAATQQLLGINPGPEGWFVSERHERRPGDEKHLFFEKEALKEVTKGLNQEQIPWWIDCGTCLGAYRYGGVIPWDGDIDIGVLRPDFDNVCYALNRLDPKKYVVQDWSTREHPKSYLKVFIRKTGTLIDIYFFDLIPEKKELQYVLALENAFFFPEWWKIRERRFKVPVKIDTLFPLKKGWLDEVEICMPCDPVTYLQRYYGQNLAPAKVYDKNTGQYERDLSHPYWKNAYVH